MKLFLWIDGSVNMLIFDIEETDGYWLNDEVDSCFEDRVPFDEEFDVEL